MVDEEVLRGGVANAGAVARVGQHVLRPSNPQTELIHRFLHQIRSAGFNGVPEPVGRDPDGRERLVFIEGDVAYPPLPAWSQTDDALASIASLLARFHAAGAGFVTPPGVAWSTELADPEGGALICHNDVCLENVVFSDGVAVALLDFDFAAPGRALYDLAQMAKMCVTIDTPDDAALWGWGPCDPFRRLRIVADAYGLAPDRAELVGVLEDALVVGDEFVKRHVDRGEPAFVQMWESMGGRARSERRHRWFEENRSRFLRAIG